MTYNFNEFRRIYSELDSRRRTVWSMARAKFEMITGDGLDCIMVDREGNRMRARHHATVEVIIEGVKAYSQFLYAKADMEGRDNPYQYVPGAQVWLNRGCWDDMDAHEREQWARKYDARTAKVRLVG